MRAQSYAYKDGWKCDMSLVKEAASAKDVSKYVNDDI